MSASPLNHAVADDPIHQTRVDLAACLRMAVLDDLHEGIDNHFTVVVPGCPTSACVRQIGVLD